MVSSYLRESGDSETMPNLCSEPRPPLHPPLGPHPPPAFWDNLSKIWLTFRALEELDRRNTQSAPSLRSGRPVTQLSITRWEGGQGSELDTDVRTCCTTGRSEEIKVFSRHGGPDLSDLRGCGELVIMNPSPRGRKLKLAFAPKTNPSEPTTKTTTTRNSRPYDRNYQQNLIDGGVYPAGYQYLDGRLPARPNNWEEICHRLVQRRRSLSPSQFSDNRFREFQQANANSFKENQVKEKAIPFITGHITDDRHVVGNIPFTNLGPLTDGTLAPGNPDFCHGARPEQLDIQVRNQLSQQIIPSTQLDLPILPNFFLAVKGPDGTMAVAGRQANYDGALGARGIHALQSYGHGELAYNNNAYIITSIYISGYLNMYTCHPAQPNGPGSRPEYYMTQLRSFAMTDTADTFRQGATAFRNARDWAKEQRDQAIRHANDRANGIPRTTPTDSALAAVHQGTSTDQLAVNRPAKRSSRLRQSRKRKRNTGALGRVDEELEESD